MAYIGNSPANVGNYQLVDDIASGFNGSLVSFALASGGIAITPAKSGQILANINGVMQEPDDGGTNGFKIVSSNIVFSSAPANGDTFWAVYQGQNVDIGTPSDDVVDTAHIKDDAVTADKLANSINSAITANTAKTGITSSQATAITAALPKTGGIITAGEVDFNDNIKARFGTGKDLNIYHDGSNSYVEDASVGDLILKTDGAAIKLLGGTDTMAKGTKDGAFGIYHDNNVKLATSATGVTVTGNLNSTGASLDGVVVINESGADVDFRVESDTITHALHLDATNGQIANGSGSFKLGSQTTASNNFGWNFDIADAGTISCAQGTAVKIGNFTSSGMILVNDTTVTGQVGLFVTGGAGFTICGQTNAIYQITSSPGTNHVGLYQAGGYVYIKNGMPQNLGASIMTFRTRSAQ